MSNFILALDIGTTGTKAALVDETGTAQHPQYRAYQTRFSQGNLAEQNPDDWWQAAMGAIRLIAYSNPEIPPQIVAITVSGQMQDLILTKNGEPVRTAILYNDARAVNEAEYLNQTIGSETLRRITGNDQDASSLLAKLLWLKKNQPKHLADTDRILTGAHDFIVLKLCGEAVSDVGTASTTGLLNLSERTWAVDLLEKVGLPDLPLGKLVPGGTVVGQLSARAAGYTGLPKGLPVCHGPGDAGATTLGAGAGEPGTIYAYLGTSGWVGFTSEQAGNPEQGVWTLAHPKPNYLLPVAPILTAGGCLEWLRDEFKASGAMSYQDYSKQASQAPTSELLFMPYLSGERAPFRDPSARGVFIGITRRTTTRDLYRAVFEGVTYAYRHLLDSLSVERPAAIVMTGGGTKSQFWMQLFADILNIPIIIPPDPQNVGVRGAALAAWVARGTYDNYAPPEFFHFTSRIEPAGDRPARYDAYYSVFREMHNNLQSTFDGMQKAARLSG